MTPGRHPMLTQRLDAFARFTRRDAARFVIATGILVAVLTAILGADILPQEALSLAAGDLAPRDIVAPQGGRVRERGPHRGRAGAQPRDAVDAPVRLHIRERCAIAMEQQLAFERRVSRVDTTFAADLPDDQRVVAAGDRRPRPPRGADAPPSRPSNRAAGRSSGPSPRACSIRCSGPSCSTRRWPRPGPVWPG